MNYATILVHHSLVLGDYKRSYEWQGPRDAPVIVPHTALRDTDHNGRAWPARIILDGLPPLRYLPGSESYADLFIRDAALYVRIDAAGWLNWAHWATRRVLLRMFWFVYERCVLTLHVWGLADYEPNRRPSWRDIRLFSRRRRSR